MSGKKRLTAVSLFSGCGGLDLGFEAAGYHILSAHDIDPLAVKNYNANLRPVATVSDVSSEGFAVPSGVDIVLSGSPCQGFSLVGKRELGDPRNSLLLIACRLVASSQPRAALFENVPGAIVGAHRAIWDEGVKILLDSGYRVSFETVAMSDYGIPQMRKRIVLVAFRDGESFSLNSKMKRTLAIPLRQAFEKATTCDSGDEFYAFQKDSIDWKIANRISPNQKLCDVRAGSRSVHSWDIPEVFGQTNELERELLSTILLLRRSLRRRKTGDADPVDIQVLLSKFGTGIDKCISRLVDAQYLTFDGKYVDLSRRFNGKYRRLSWDELSYTVDTNFGNARYFIHPEEPRGLSVREAARIQGFPDTYKFEGKIRDKFRLIGNAVPPSVALNIANAIKDRLRK
jgi:DNA (cytosine-5)-methyltransferase 1